MKKKHRHITLIEIIIVMFFISVITGVIAYNVKGSLDEGKAFQTVESKKQLKNVLELSISSGQEIPSGQLSETQLLEFIGRSPLVSNPKKLLKDGWGNVFVVSFDSQTDQFTIESNAFEQYRRTHPNSLFQDNEE